jgi:hypothetical protein
MPTDLPYWLVKKNYSAHDTGIKKYQNFALRFHSHEQQILKTQSSTHKGGVDEAVIGQNKIFDRELQYNPLAWYVFMYVCMCVSMYVCIYVRTYVCVDVWMGVYMYVYMR